MNESELTIVTAFFDCGRGNHSSQKRTNDEYIEYFKFWARIKNKVVIYTMPDIANKVYKIRKEFGLDDKTVVISDVNVWENEKTILEKMQMVEKKGLFAEWRYKPNDISNQANYSYIMLMKYWFMYDASRRNLVEQNAVWLDFGWNHGGKVFPKSEEFDFLWEYDFDYKKIHIFSRNNPDESQGIINMQFMNDCFMGSPIVCNKNMCKKLYTHVKNSMDALLSLDCFDDDQLLLLMAYKRNPEDFCIHYSDWFIPMKQFGGNHLTVRTIKKTNPNIMEIIKTNGILLIMKKCLLKILFQINYENYVFFKRIKRVIKRVNP